MSVLKFTPPIIAHRGASGYAPENTLAAFVKAKELGANWVECDVQLTADGELVLFHDEMLDRTTDGQGALVHCSAEQLQKLDAGSWFAQEFAHECILSFRAFLEFLQQAQLAANVELKPWVGQERLLAKKVIAELNKSMAAPWPNILFSSFSVPALAALRELAPKCAIGLLMDHWLYDWPQLCAELECLSVHVNHKILNPSRVQEIKSQHKYLLCYTVNEAKQAAELFSWRVDAVFTDFPDKILQPY